MSSNAHAGPSAGPSADPVVAPHNDPHASLWMRLMETRAQNGRRSLA